MQHSEIERIQELLVTDNTLEFLKGLDEPVLKELKQVLEDYIQRIEENQKPVYKVMAMACKFIPNFIIANLAQSFLTPYIVGQITHYLDPKESGKIGRSFKHTFLTDVTLYVEPALTAKIADHMGVVMVQKVIEELLKKEQFHRLGELADELSPTLLKQITGKVGPAELGQIVSYMKNESQVSQIAANSSAANKQKIRTVLENSPGEEQFLRLF